MRQDNNAVKNDIDLMDLTFDFKKYFKEYEALTEREQDEFQCRVMGQFCKELLLSDGDPSAISPWVARYIADAFFQVLGGVPFNQVLPTPFEPMQSIWSEKENRALKTYCFVENGVRAGGKVSDLLMKRATEINVSYETARGDYYMWKKRMKSAESE